MILNLKKLFLSLCYLLLATILIADEGMWMLDNLTSGNWERMKELGFSLSEEQLYSSEQGSLKDAVVIFGGGCTGVTVSDKGLIFTNHHCGYDAIQSQSSVEHDYLKNGFVASTMEEELKIPDLEIRYLLYTQNVTEKLLAAVDTIADEVHRAEIISQLCKQIQDSVSNGNEFIDAGIYSYFNKNEYYLNVYEVFKDIRMVLAPPSSIGKFGGETDNWMWPRHTGDFSIFRVYANPENQPAEYNPENIPYTPKSFIHISLSGYKENDYAMTIGFPGSTSRYLSSWGVLQRVKDSNEPRIEARGIKQGIWKEDMLASDEIRIKYASKYARSSNYWKNSIGMNKGIQKMNVTARKQVIENNFRDWLNQNPDQQPVYGNALKLIEENYTQSDDMRKDYTYLLETLINGTEITRLGSIAMKYDVNQTKDETDKYWKEKLEPFYKDYDPSLDQKVLAAMLKLAKERINPIYLPHIYSEIDKKFKGDYEKYAAYVFEKSVVPYPEKLRETLKDGKKVKKLSDDPVYKLTSSAVEMMEATFAGLDSYRYDTSKGERLFLAGLRMMNPEKDFYSDANFTMRMSYGSIAGYIPYDGAWYDYSTTQKGILEKYDISNPEFNVQDDILRLLNNRDFEPYAKKDEDLNICFISNNDITGGNSGSPIFNGQGKLIGLAFDGNWEAMSGDIVFEPEVQRTIGVDIRYVLFIIDKWGKCNRLIEEVILD